MSINRNLLVEIFEMNRSALVIPDSSSNTLHMYTYDDEDKFDCFFAQKRMRTYEYIKTDTIVILEEGAGGGGILIFTEKSMFLFWGPIIREVSYIDISWKENSLMFGTLPCPLSGVNQYVLRKIIEKVVTYNENNIRSCMYVE